MARRRAADGLAEGSGAASVSATDVRVTYRNRTVLDVARFTIESSQTYALLGASGAGKTTLLRVIGLLEPPTQGTVLYDGRAVARDDLAARRRIAAVFQKPYLMRGTVGANVEYGLKLRHVPRAERKSRAAEALEAVGMGGWERRSALMLSGGEAQRVALARALVLKPNLLLLDEPLSYLDPLLKRDLAQEFARILSSEHVTSLYVTHDRDEASVVADTIGVMRDGRIVEEGDARTLMTMPTDIWVASFLGTEPPVEGVVSGSNDGVATVRCCDFDVKAVADVVAGVPVRVGVRPEDVLLFEEGAVIAPSGRRNLLEAVVMEVISTGMSVRAVVEVAGCRFASTVSQTAASSLGLATGVPVTMLFDAAAVCVREVER